MTLEFLLADIGTLALPGAALVVSMVAVTFSAFMGTRTSSTSSQVNRINTLQARVAECEDKIDTCEADRDRLERQNLLLMERLLKLENGH